MIAHGFLGLSVARPARRQRIRRRNTLDAQRVRLSLPCRFRGLRGGYQGIPKHGIRNSGREVADLVEGRQRAAMCPSSPSGERGTRKPTRVCGSPMDLGAAGLIEQDTVAGNREFSERTSRTGLQDNQSKRGTEWRTRAQLPGGVHPELTRSVISNTAPENEYTGAPTSAKADRAATVHLKK